LAAKPVLAADPISLSDQFGQGLETAATRQFDEVQAKAQRTGKVRVIVHLTRSAIPAGKLSAQARLDQRAFIAQAQTEILSTVTAARPETVKRFNDIPYLAMEVDTAALEQLRASPEIKAITEDKIARASLQQSVPLIGGTNAWAAGYSGAGQAVAVLDTGVDKQHPFLAGKVVAEACFSTNAFDQFFESACPNKTQEQIGVGAGVNCAADDCDHGTHVAGIAAGAAGVAKGASIIAVQVFTLSSSQEFCGFFAPCTVAFDSDILKGMEFVFSQRNRLKIASVNLSLGGAKKYTEACDGFPDVEPIRVAAANLRSAGIATIFAAGNSGFKDGLSTPACLSNVISVGATDKGDFVADFSNSSRLLSLLAPGVNIVSSVPGGDQQSKSGTSMAAPHVAGAWAVLKSKRPTATVDEILGALSRTGVPISDDWNQIVKPRIQIDAALNALAGTAPPGPPPPPAPLTPLSPSGSIVTTTPTYRWIALQDSSWYLIWLYDQSGALVYTSYVTPFDAGCSGKVTACAHTPNRSLSIGKGYSWYVSAVKGIRVFDSAKLSFTVVR
jgi:subtilisin family serine protease